MVHDFNDDMEKRLDEAEKTNEKSTWCLFEHDPALKFK